MDCPVCGETGNEPTTSDNGGDMYVAKDVMGSTEWYDDIDMYKCRDCHKAFYVSKST